jgi:hypothetical protein
MGDTNRAKTIQSDNLRRNFKRLFLLLYGLLYPTAKHLFSVDEHSCSL